MNLRLILNGYLFGSSNLIPLEMFLWGWMQREVYTKKQTKVDTPDELPTRSLHSATRTEKREDQLRRTTNDLRTRIAKCIKREIGILEHL